MVPAMRQATHEQGQSPLFRVDGAGHRRVLWVEDKIHRQGVTLRALREEEGAMFGPAGLLGDGRCSSDLPQLSPRVSCLRAWGTGHSPAPRALRCRPSLLSVLVRPVGGEAPGRADLPGPPTAWPQGPASPLDAPGAPPTEGSSFPPHSDSGGFPTALQTSGQEPLLRDGQDPHEAEPSRRRHAQRAFLLWGTSGGACLYELVPAPASPEPGKQIVNEKQRKECRGDPGSVCETDSST